MVSVWCFGLILLSSLIYVIIQSNRRNSIVDTTNNKEDVEGNEENENKQQNQDGQKSNSTTLTSKDAIAIPLLAALTAFFLSVWMHCSCQFFDVDEESSLSSIGLWTSKYLYISNVYVGRDDTCYSNFPGSSDYDDFGDVRLSLVEIDGALVTAMIGAVIASVFGGIALVVLVCFCLSPTFSTSKVRQVAFLLWIATLAQALTLVVFATKECRDSSTCDMDIGGVVSCTSIFFWVLSAFGASFVPL